MILSGTGITTTTIKVKEDFIPKTVYAFNWKQLSNGEYYCVDRGYDADTYDTEIRLYGTESYINNIINQIEANRTAISGTPNVIQLSGFNSQEHIFGSDIDYSSSLNCTVYMQRRIQGTWKGFGVTIGLSLMSPSFVGAYGFLPTFQFLDYGYDADSDYTINKFDSYNRSFFFQDHASDAGIFTGVFTFTDAQMIGLRRFIATNRGQLITMPTFSGVAYPFGRRTPGAMAALIAFEDQGQIGLNMGQPRWKAKITIVEHISNLYGWVYQISNNGWVYQISNNGWVYAG
jgi:hypothetical protein